MTLKELIDSEPLNAGRTDQQVLDWLEENITQAEPISYTDLVVWASENQVFHRTRVPVAEVHAGTSTLSNAAQNDLMALDVLLKSGGNLDLTRQDVRSLFNTITGAGLPLAPAHRAALFAKSDRSVARWDFGTPHQPSRLALVAEARNA